MGNTIQEHRVQIGVFESKTHRFGWKIKKMKTKSKNFSTGKDVKLLLFTLLFHLGGSLFCSNNKLSKLSSINYSSFNVLPKSVKVINNNFESRYKFGNR